MCVIVRVCGYVCMHTITTSMIQAYLPARNVGADMCIKFVCTNFQVHISVLMCGDCCVERFYRISSVCLHVFEHLMFGDGWVVKVSSTVLSLK